MAAPPPDADPRLHAWFERQYSVAGAWCCDVSDGHILRNDEWRIVDGHYEVVISGRWQVVPDSALRDPKGGPNPTGAAIAWYRNGHLSCFAPGFSG